MHHNSGRQLRRKRGTTEYRSTVGSRRWHRSRGSHPQLGQHVANGIYCQPRNRREWIQRPRCRAARFLRNPCTYGAPASYGVQTLYGTQSSDVGTANSGIWVTGQATLEIPADIAQVSIGIESRETTVAEARQNAAAAMDSVLAAIRAHGVADDDIVTSYFNIQPQTIWIEVTDSIGRHSEPRIIGYIVNNTVQVTVRDIDNLGPVVDSAATAGGDLIRINSIQFTVDDPSVFGEQIRVMAAADALAKADLYARVMGVTLGPVVYLTELGNSVPMVRAAPVAEMAAMDMSFARTPISAGDVNLSVSVQVVFAIVG